MVTPDGWSETCDKSIEFDAKRKEFVEYLKKYRNDDGSSAIKWFEACYGSDDRSATITDSEWHDKPTPPTEDE